MTGRLRHLSEHAPLWEALTCQQCGERLRLDLSAAVPQCSRCSWPAGEADGILDFARDPAVADERAHYEAEYHAANDLEPVALDELEDLWTHPARPVNRVLRRHMGDLTNQRVLLIGNGGSVKELHFLTDEPRLVLYSDLTTAGVRAVAERVDLDRHADRVCFAAMDAMHLPLADGTIDVIYGNAMIHHIPEEQRERCLAELARVLAAGGRAVFMDDAHVPLWQRSKETWLRPLMRFSHRHDPRSPEDLRHTEAGGFTEQELAPVIRSVGGEPFFERLGLVFHLWRRFATLVLPRSLRHLRNHRGVGRVLTGLDERLGRRYPAVRRNQMRLVWGWRQTGN